MHPVNFLQPSWPNNRSCRPQRNPSNSHVNASERRAGGSSSLPFSWLHTCAQCGDVLATTSSNSRTCNCEHSSLTRNGHENVCSGTRGVHASCAVMHSVTGSPSAKILFGVVDHSHSGKPPPGQPVCAQQSAPPTYEQQPAPTPPPVQPVYAQPAPPMYEPQAAPAPPPGQPPPTYEPQPVPAPPPGQPVQPAPPTYEPQPVPAVPHWPRTRLCPGSLTDDLSMATTCQCRQADRAYVLARAWRLA